MLLFQATLFQTLPAQQTEAQLTSASRQSSQAAADVIQQLLGLSDPGTVEPSPPQAGQQLGITVGINQDILQVRPAAHSCLCLSTGCHCGGINIQGLSE